MRISDARPGGVTPWLALLVAGLLVMVAVVGYLLFVGPSEASQAPAPHVETVGAKTHGR